MAEHALAIAGARQRTIDALEAKLAGAADDPFARAAISIEGWTGGDLQSVLKANRLRDAAAGRAVEGPHRQDLAAVHRGKAMPAARSSTGEQKALLLGLVLAHAELVAERHGEPPILLLDEVAAHLDPTRRSALYAALTRLDAQVWMSAADPAVFAEIEAEAALFAVRPGHVERQS